MVQLYLDSTLFSIKAIRRTIYEMKTTACIYMESTKNDCIEVSINIQSEDVNTQMIENQFKQLVQDHQLRIELEEEYHQIRQILLAQAFFPCSNLDDIIKNNTEV
jgi:His-Xaa-Ser system protein HxsD